MGVGDLRYVPMTSRSVLAFCAAAALYTFVAMLLLDRLTSQLSDPTLGFIGVFSFSIALVPVCIVAAWKRLSVAPALLLYLLLAYVATWARSVSERQPLSFNADLTSVSTPIQIENSFVLAAIAALVNLVPTFFVWLIARVVVEISGNARRRSR
jgi:hypothetical protein